MLENKEKKLQIYEEPMVQVAYVNESDVLRTSPDAGVEYPSDDWN